MDEVNNKPKHTRRVIKVSRKKFIVAILVIVVVGFFCLLANSFYSQRYYSFGGGMTNSVTAPSIATDSNYTPPMYKGYGGNSQPTITDTREFLKTSYSATIKTRDVASTVTDIKNIVKGSDGRVDSVYSSEKSGYVNFVVAKSKFDAFKAEVEALTNRKLYTETISSQNLLSQKQNIESQTTSIITTLDSLNKQKTDLTAQHTKIVSTINAELSRIKTELAVLRAKMASPTYLQTTVSPQADTMQETDLVNQDTAQRQKLTVENNSYATQKQNLDNQIANFNNGLTNVNQQNTQFTDNIETVNGSVYVSWVSLWTLVTIFSPISPVIIIIILILIALIYLRHLGYVPKIEWY